VENRCWCFGRKCRSVDECSDLDGFIRESFPNVQKMLALLKQGEMFENFSENFSDNEGNVEKQFQIL